MVRVSRAVLLAMVVMAAWAASAFAQPLRPDPRLTPGQLDNGLRYCVFKYPKNANRAAVWLQISAGSMREADDQRGAAHAITHLAFAGSEDFPGQAAVAMLERFGSPTSPDQVSTVTFDQATFQISLPDNSPVSMREALAFFRNVLSGLTLADEDVGRVRDAMVEERSKMLTPSARSGEEMMRRLIPASPLATRPPLPEEAAVQALTPSAVKAFYQAHYRAPAATVIVGGDVDPAAVAGMIKEVLGGLPGGTAPKPVDLAVTPSTTQRAAVIVQSDLPQTTVGFSRVLEPASPLVTVAAQREAWMDMLAAGVFSRRLSEAAKRRELTLTAGGAAVLQASGVRLATVQGTAQAPWNDVLGQVTRVLAQARKFGFSQREVVDARRELVRVLERQARLDDDAPLGMHLSRLNAAIASGAVPMSPTDTLALSRTTLDAITAEELTAYFNAAYDPSHACVFAQVSAGSLTEQGLQEAANAALAADVQAPAEEARVSSLLTKLPEPGLIVEEHADAATGVWSAWLANGVRVHHLQNDSRKDSVYIAISLLGAEILETPSNRGITNAVVATSWAQPATRQYSNAQIRSLLAGRKLSLTGRSGADAAQIRMEAVPEDLDMAFQLAHLLLTQPVVDAPALGTWKSRRLQINQETERNPIQMFERLCADMQYPDDDVRLRSLTNEQIGAIEPPAAQAWANTMIAQWPIEVAVVGDVSQERTKELVARYLGSLPERAKPSPMTWQDKRRRDLPPGPRNATRTVVSSIPQAAVMVAAYGPDKSAVADVRAVTLAAEVLTQRMAKVLQQEKHLVQGARAMLQPGDAMPGFGLLAVRAPCQPAKAPELLASIKEMFEQMAATPATAEEVEAAKKMIISQLEDQSREPKFWLERLETLDYDGLTLEAFGPPAETYGKIEAGEVAAAFGKYYAPDRVISVQVTPVPPPPSQPAQPGARPRLPGAR